MSLDARLPYCPTDSSEIVTWLLRPGKGALLCPNREEADL